MKQITYAFGIFAAVAAMSISSSVLDAQATRSTADGVFTAEQAKRGEKFYAENCSFCHGDDLKGSDVIPTLQGEAFLKTYKDKPIADLYLKINTSMPATAPGSMTPQQTADSVAYILSVLKLPAGTTELPAKADELKTVTLVVP